MNFDLGPHELALREGIRELCTRRFPIDRVREGFDRRSWSALAEAGVFTLRVPEESGGVGLQMTEAVIVFQELGRFLVAGPLVATHLAGDAERVVGMAEGGLLEHPDEVDAVMVIGETVAVGPPPVVTKLDPLDPLTPVGRTEGKLQVDPTDLDPQHTKLEGAALTAALLAGNAGRTAELATSYAKEREQFGRPIGSFQAVKHMCADMFVRAEVCRAAVDAAGVLLDAQSAEASSAVYTAKLLASEYAMANAKGNIQVHGGMGFTWEVDAHLYLKRAAVLSTHFGPLHTHAEALAQAL